MMTAEQIIERQGALETEAERTNFDDLWKRGAEICWPDANSFNLRFTPGQRRDRINYDSTASESNWKFAAVMESLLTPREKIYHELAASDEELNKDPEVKRWFEELNKILFRVRNAPSSYYYSQKHQGYLSLGAFGNECLHIAERKGGGIRYCNYHIGQIYIETDADGLVDTVYRKYELTARQAILKWGEDALPKPMISASRTTPSQKYWFIHAVIPNDELDPEALDDRAMPFTAYDVCCDSRRLLPPPVGTTSRGYEEQPFKFSRYTVLSNEKYGRGPAQIVMAAMLGANQMKRDFLASGHKAVDPPILAHSDAVRARGNRQVDLRAGALNPGLLDANMRPMIQAFENGVRLPDMQFMLEGEQQTVKNAFLVPLYEALLENPQMTATQVLELRRETGIYIAPMIGRQHSESLDPQIEREIAILMRQGMVPPMPPALLEAEGEYDIVHDTPGTRDQRADDALAIVQTIQMSLQLAEQDPGILDRFKGDDIVKELAKINGMPSSLIRSDKEMEALAARRAQEAEQQQASQQAAVDAEALDKLGGAAEKFSRAAGGPAA